MTNGTTGYCTYVERESYDGKRIKIDFKPDFSKSEHRNLYIDYKRLMTQNLNNDDPNSISQRSIYDEFEFAYAITVHSSQGSQWKNVLFFVERFMNAEDFKKFLYTGITRAMDGLTIVM